MLAQFFQFFSMFSQGVAVSYLPLIFFKSYDDAKLGRMNYATISFFQLILLGSWGYLYAHKTLMTISLMTVAASLNMTGLFWGDKKNHEGAIDPSVAILHQLIDFTMIALIINLAYNQVLIVSGVSSPILIAGVLLPCFSALISRITNTLGITSKPDWLQQLCKGMDRAAAVAFAYESYCQQTLFSMFFLILQAAIIFSPKFAQIFYKINQLIDIPMILAKYSQKRTLEYFKKANHYLYQTLAYFKEPPLKASLYQLDVLDSSEAFQTENDLSSAQTVEAENGSISVTFADADTQSKFFYSKKFCIERRYISSPLVTMVSKKLDEIHGVLFGQGTDASVYWNLPFFASYDTRRQIAIQLSNPYKASLTNNDVAFHAKSFEKYVDKIKSYSQFSKCSAQLDAYKSAIEKLAEENLASTESGYLWARMILDSAVLDYICTQSKTDSIPQAQEISAVQEEKHADVAPPQKEEELDLSIINEHKINFLIEPDAPNNAQSQEQLKDQLKIFFDADLTLNTVNEKSFVRISIALMADKLSVKLKNLIDRNPNHPQVKLLSRVQTSLEKWPGLVAFVKGDGRKPLIQKICALMLKNLTKFAEPLSDFMEEGANFDTLEKHALGKVSEQFLMYLENLDPANATQAACLPQYLMLFERGNIQLNSLSIINTVLHDWNEQSIQFEESKRSMHHENSKTISFSTSKNDSIEKTILYSEKELVDFKYAEPTWMNYFSKKFFAIKNVLFFALRVVSFDFAAMQTLKNVLSRIFARVGIKLPFDDRAEFHAYSARVCANKGIMPFITYEHLEGAVFPAGAAFMGDISGISALDFNLMIASEKQDFIKNIIIGGFLNEIYKSYKVEKALDKYNALMDFFKGELEEYNFEALRYVLEPYISCSLNLDGVAFEHLDKEIIKDKSEEQLNSFLDKLGEILAFYHLLNKNFFILNTERECELKKTSTQIIASNQSVIKEKAGQPLVPYLPTYDQPIFDKELIFSGLPIGLAFAKKCVEKPRR